jgi:hypothetical protein
MELFFIVAMMSFLSLYVGWKLEESFPNIKNIKYYPILINMYIILILGFCKFVFLKG